MILLQLINRADHLNALKNVVRQCADYSMMVEGHLPSDEDIEALFEDVPPGFSVQALIPNGVFDGQNSMVGMLWAVRDYPEAGTLFIPLFLIAETQRKHGFGREATGQFEAWGRSAGFQKIRLSVVKENENALRFWQKQGFQPTGELPARQFGQKIHERFEFEKQLS
jgi:ribosomal protein S18 acetylase RimI-like enzyme